MSYAIETSVDAVQAVIRPLVSAAWVTDLGYGEDTIAWPNAGFDPPGNGPWLRVSYTDQSTNPFNWGGGTVLNQAISVLQLQVFVPKNIGVALLNAAADKMRSTFERQSFGAGVRFRGALGPSYPQEPRWAVALIQLPFEFFEAITL